MAYLDAGSHPADRAKAAATVIGIHALLGFGLVAGLAVTGVIIEEDTPFEGTPVVFDPPPPEIPEVVPETSPPIASSPQAPDSPFEFETTNPVVVMPVTEVPTEPVRIPGTITEPIIPSPIATPTPAIVPVAPRPRNSVQSWITSNDYLRRDLTREREGIARYRLVVGSDGGVDACEITASTGHTSLDRNTCRLIQRRARFEPATDGNGARVVGTYTGTVTWQIPE